MGVQIPAYAAASGTSCSSKVALGICHLPLKNQCVCQAEGVSHSLEVWKEKGEFIQPALVLCTILFMILERRGIYFLALSFMIPGPRSQVVDLFWLPEIPG